MNSKRKQKDNFNSYFKEANDNKRLTKVLFLFAFLISPFFSFLFFKLEVPLIYSILMLSLVIFFPIFILLNIKFKNIKLPFLYFLFFIVIESILCYEMYNHQFDSLRITFFIGMFGLLNFALQRFWYSLIYFVVVFIQFSIYLILHNDWNSDLAPIYALFITIGISFLAVYFSRDKMIQKLQDYNYLLKRILNNPGNGFVLFEIEEKQVDYIIVKDHNQESFNLLSSKENKELENQFNTFLSEEDKKTIKNLRRNHLFQMQYYLDQESKTIDVRIISLRLKSGKYFLATLVDITQQIKKQNQLSKEMIRAELAEETNKLLEVEIKERILAKQKAQKEALRTKSIFESSSETLLLTLDLEFKVLMYNSHFNSYFQNQTEISFNEGDDFIGHVEKIFSTLDYRYIRLLLQSVRKGESHQIEIWFKNKRGFGIWLEIFINPIFDNENNICEISLVLHDITTKKENEVELRNSLKEKEILLKEVHHRVKNNLQVISSILNLQSSFVSDKKILAVLEESRNRVRSMAIIHENLYKNSNFSSIDFTRYVRELTLSLIDSYRYSTTIQVSLTYDLEEIELTLDQAIPCGLIINEIITNSMKYAFTDRIEGNIYLQMKSNAGKLEIQISDDGKGISPEFNIISSDSLGIQLINTLIEQLEGELIVDNSEGLKYLIIFEMQNI